MSPVVSYVLGFFTVPFLVVAYLVGDELHGTGRESQCPRHDWTSGDKSHTRRWRYYTRHWIHTLRYHRHGERWDFQ